jgi:CSLREA domain-containing protein
MPAFHPARSALILPFARVSVLSLLLLPLCAQAAEIKVSKTSDSQDGACDSDCSLREAVIKANSTSGEQLIRLATGTYQLTLPAPKEDGDVFDEDANEHGDLDVSGSLTIRGAGIDKTFIDGNFIDRLIEVLPGARLTLSHLTLTRGRHSDDGGAIRNQGELYINDAVFERNVITHSFSPVRGGAIANYGLLRAVRTTFRGNIADTGDTNWSLGGAVYNQGELWMRDIEWRGNSARTDDVISAGGGLFNMGTADIARALFVGNDTGEGSGSAISNQNGGQLSLRNVTVSGNTGDSYRPDGAVANGAVYPYQPDYPNPPLLPSMYLEHVTIAANQGSVGLLNLGQLRVRNSLVMATQSDLTDPDLTYDLSVNCLNSGGQATFNARGLLLGQDGGNCVGDLPPAREAQAFTKVMFPLADNYASLPTHALRRGSPAVDTAVGSCPQDDQRARARPQDGDGDGIAVCDIGAFERPRY